MHSEFFFSGILIDIFTVAVFISGSVILSKIESNVLNVKLLKHFFGNVAIFF